MREETSSHYFLLCWNVGALLCLLTPLLIRFISFVSYKLVSKNNNGNQSSWWPWQNNNSQWELGNGVVIFVYIWSFAIFAFLVWYGNMVFRKPANPLPLLSALVMHANLSLMCGLLVFSLEGSGEVGWLHTFEMSCVLTLSNYVVFSLVFVYWIRRRSREADWTPEISAFDQLTREISAVSGDYQREPTSHEIEQREPNHIKASWSFY